MKRRVIAVDCDDVLIATAADILPYYNKKYGTKIELKDFYSDDPKVWGVSDNATAIERVEEYLTTNEHQSLKPFDEAIAILQQLGKYHEIHMVTGRSEALRSFTENLLARHFPGIFTSIEFTNLFGKAYRPKSQVCRDLGVDLLIDDHLKHVTAVAQIGIEAWLFGEYPWNQIATLPPNVLRVRDWHEISDLLRLG